MSMPISVIIAELENAPSLIVPILESLYYDKSLLAIISKLDSKHLISRTLNLVRSVSNHSKWCGATILRVLCTDMEVIASDGAAIFTALFRNLELHTDSFDSTMSLVFSATLDTISYLCLQIRGKPTMTRELLTPRLAPLISILVEKLHLEPASIVSILHTLMWNHSTTFRPFANKFKLRLVSLIVRHDWANSNKELQTTVYKALAGLPIIEKTDPATHWHENIINTVRETLSSLALYGEFLNLNDDADIQRLFSCLPHYDDNASTAQHILPSLSIDVNEPRLLLLISDRVLVLLAMLTQFSTVETTFAVMIPIGIVLAVGELACSINTKFVSFRNDIRDVRIQNLLKATLGRVHASSLELVILISQTFNGNIVPHAMSIFSMLETVVPTIRNRIDYSHLIQDERLMRLVLECAIDILDILVRLDIPAPIIRLVDAALALLEPRQSAKISTAKVTNPSNKTQKNNHKVKADAIPLADILSHQHLFAAKVPKETESVAYRFFAKVVSAVNLPASQQNKIMMHAVIGAALSHQGSAVPADIHCLLSQSIITPGTRTGSLLPMVSRLFPTDPLVTVFNNPRFPQMPLHVTIEQQEFAAEMEVNTLNEEEYPLFPLGHKRHRNDRKTDDANSNDDEHLPKRPRLSGVENEHHTPRDSFPMVRPQETDSLKSIIQIKENESTHVGTTDRIEITAAATTTIVLGDEQPFQALSYIHEPDSVVEFPDSVARVDTEKDTSMLTVPQLESSSTSMPKIGIHSPSEPSNESDGLDFEMPVIYMDDSDSEDHSSSK